MQLLSVPYGLVPNEKFQSLNGLAIVDLENGRLRNRVGQQVLNGNLSDLRVGVGNEAHELYSILATEKRKKK